MRLLALLPALMLPALPALALELPELKVRGVLRVIVAREEQPETFASGRGSA